MSTMTQDDARSAAGTRRATSSRHALWTGRVLSVVAALFLAFDASGKLMRVDPVIAGTVQLGYPASAVLGMGVLLALCLVAYVIPKTSVLGAVLLTGYLGGAVASQVRVSAPLLSHTLFPIYVATFVWGGLFLRKPQLRGLFPARSRA